MADTDTTPGWDRTAKANQDIDYFISAYRNVFSESDILRLERIRGALPESVAND